MGNVWDPQGYFIWRNEPRRREEYKVIESPCHWGDGLREAVMALLTVRPPLVDLDHYLHPFDVIEAARCATKEGVAVPVNSEIKPQNLRPEELRSRRARHHVHDHTRPVEEQ